MVLNLKIEILKVFSLEFNFTSENKKKEVKSVQESLAPEIKSSLI